MNLSHTQIGSHTRWGPTHTPTPHVSKHTHKYNFRHTHDITAAGIPTARSHPEPPSPNVPDKIQLQELGKLSNNWAEPHSPHDRSDETSHYQGMASPSRVNDACKLLFQFQKGHSTELPPCSADRSAAAVPMSVLRRAHTQKQQPRTHQGSCQDSFMPTGEWQNPACWQLEPRQDLLSARSCCSRPNTQPSTQLCDPQVCSRPPAPARAR